MYTAGRYAWTAQVDNQLLNGIQPQNIEGNVLQRTQCDLETRENNTNVLMNVWCTAEGGGQVCVVVKKSYGPPSLSKNKKLDKLCLKY